MKRVKVWRKIVCFVLILGLFPILDKPVTVHASTSTWIMSGIFCQEGKELTHEESMLYVNKEDYRAVNKGTFSTGGFSSYCTQSDYIATVDNEGTMNFDGAHNELSTFAMPVFNNKGTLVIDHCYNFSIDGVLVNTGIIFLSNVEGFGGGSKEIDNTNGTIVYDHNSQIGGSLLKKLKGLGGTVMTKEAYEQVKPQTFPITYELDGGVYLDGGENPSEYTYDPVAPDATIEISNQPVKRGYTFKGWYVDGESIGVQPVLYTVDREPKTLRAHWEETVFQIHYELDGGALESGENPVRYTVSSEGFTLHGPVKPGYVFDGWTGSNGEEPEKSITVPTGSIGNLTYRANWTPRGDIDYAVDLYYQHLDGTYAAAPDGTVPWKGETGTQVTIPAATYIKDGFELDAEKSEVSGTVIQDGSLRLKMYYKRKECTISFYQWDGTVAEVKKVLYGGTVEPPQASREAELDYTYTFLGWAVDAPEGTVVPGPIAAIGDQSYYAVFKSIPNFRTITFERTKGFILPQNPVSRVMKGERYEITMELENEFYCIGTPEWGQSLRECHIYGKTESDELVVLEWNKDFYLKQDGFGKPVVLSIPKVDYDLTIILCPKYHEQHDYWISEVPSTETEQGKKTEFCYLCGKTVVTDLPLKPAETSVPTPPAEETPAPPEAVTPTPPAGETPAPPEAVTPTPSAGETPAPPEEVTPTPPAEETPAPPEAVTPTPSAGETPAPPLEVSTAPPAATAPGPAVPIASPGIAPSKPKKEKASKRLPVIGKVRASKSIHRLSWKKVKGADGYIIYAAKCKKGTKLRMIKRIQSGNITAYSHKKLKKNTWYKYKIAAYKMDGETEKIIGTSLVFHSLTEGSRNYGNAQKVSVPAKKLSLKAGKRVKISASVLSKGKKVKRHAPKIRYVVSNVSVATVSSGGRLRAKKVGNCRIYAVAQNGVYVSFLCKVYK